MISRRLRGRHNLPLDTSKLQQINRLFELPYIFVSIYTVCNVLYSMAEDPLNGQLIGPFIVEPRSTCVTAFVWGVVASGGDHDFDKKTPEVIVR